MDASTIRLILIVVGALLILLLFLWERHRERRRDSERDSYLDDADGIDSSYGTLQRSQEPGFDDYDDDQETTWVSPVRSVDRDYGGLDDSLEDYPEESAEEIGQSESAAEAAHDMPALEPLLIQLSVSARRYPFKGTDVMDVAERCGLHPGDMDIFHCFEELDGQTRVYFSMANMVKPGVFPFEAMESFTTPGLMLFAQLEGDPEDLTILDEMVATARKLALALNGDVLDDTRRPLTVKKEEDMRRAVLDNEMLWAKAVMR